VYSAGRDQQFLADFRAELAAFIGGIRKKH
jgi:hypothetical protein